MKVVNLPKVVRNELDEADKRVYNTPNVISYLQECQQDSGALDSLLNGTFARTANLGEHEHNYDTDGPGHLDRG